MLFSIDQNGCVREIPYKKNYRRWRAALTDEEYGAIVADSIGRIDGGEIHTSSWMPGDDWSGTVYDPIYRKSCNKVMQLRLQCLGVVVRPVPLGSPNGASRYMGVRAVRKGRRTYQRPHIIQDCKSP